MKILVIVKIEGKMLAAKHGGMIIMTMQHICDPL